jgi:arylsulfatase A-like enzyme
VVHTAISRTLGVVVLALVSSLLLSGCLRSSSHESGNLAEYDSVQTQSGFSATIVTGHFYEGTHSVQVSYNGNACCSNGPTDGGARLTYNIQGPLVGIEGYYGGAFFFPKDFDTKQVGYMELFRWDNSTTYGAGADKGGIALLSNHKAQLFYGGVNSVPGDADFHTIGPQFTMPYGRWVDIYVHQREHGPTSANTSLNDVYVNGKRVVNVTDPNQVNSAGRGFDRIRFGVTSVTPNQSGHAFDFWFDRGWASTTDPPPPTRPNILFIVTDDQRYNTLGCCDPNSPGGTGDWMPKTKTLFRDGDNPPGTIPSGGTLFQWAVDTTPLCCPSRSSIFTGRYAHNTGVMSNEDAALLQDDPNNQTSTIQYYLHQRAGYRTGIFGKYLNKWNLTRDPSFFDRFAIFNNESGNMTRDPVNDPNDPGDPNWKGKHWATWPTVDCPTFQSGEDTSTWNRGLNCVRERDPSTGVGVLKAAPYHQYQTTYLTNQVKSFIDEAESNDSQPWFLYVAPTLPHSPFDPEPGKYDAASMASVPAFSPTPDYLETDETKLATKPDYVSHIDRSDRPGTDTRMQGLRDSQMRMLKSVDDMVGAIYDELKLKGEDTNTLAVFISDNGFLWGVHWLATKPFPYSMGVRVPMFMRWPGHVDSNAVDTRLAANIDLVPTALDAANVTVGGSDQPIDGRDLLDTTDLRNHWLNESWFTGAPAAGVAPSWASIRTPRPPAGDTTSPWYTYIEYYGLDSTGKVDYNNTTFREYYDLRTDPYELDNKFTNDGIDNDPPQAAVAHNELVAEHNCKGHSGASPCP